MYSTFSRVTSLRSLARNVRSAAFYPLLRTRTAGFERFLENRLPLSAIKYSDEGALASLGGRYDAVVCGSDQIWNPQLPDFSEAYLLPFEHDFRKVAYAPSLGRGDLAASAHSERYRGLLRDFDSISVREVSGKEKLERLLGDEASIPVVVDPTLLLAPEEYESISSAPVVRGPYIFLYTIDFQQDAIDMARRLATRTGLPVYSVFTGPGAYRAMPALRTGIRITSTAGPEDFLSLVQHASYVVSSSFHGVAFSILFRKRFFAVLGAEGKGGMDPRIATLLDAVELNASAVRVSELDAAWEAEGPDYRDAAIRLERQTEESLAFLREALS